MCKEDWSSCKVWGARERIETLAGAYFVKTLDLTVEYVFQLEAYI